MFSRNFSLPCLSHGNCTFHKVAYQGAHGSSGSADAQKSKRVKTLPGRSPLELLPHEILLMVMNEIGPVDRACLALTSHSIANVIGLRFWDPKKAKLNAEESNGELNEFLQLLMRDFNNKYWQCRVCTVLHRRTFTKPATCSMISNLWGLMTLLNPSKIKDEAFKVRIRGETIYRLTFPVAEAMIDRMYTSGICFDTLKCSATYKYAVSNPVTTMALKIEFAPKIVLDRLLLKATYTWEVDNWKEPLLVVAKNGTGPLDWTVESIKEIDLWACEHMNATEMIQNSRLRLLTRQKLRCNYCPTQYWVSTITGNLSTVTGNPVPYSTTIQVWHNFGPCRRPGEKRWTHLVRGGEQKKEYEWERFSRTQGGCADEEIWDAYEYISFGTRAAFENVEGKFGRQPWDQKFCPDPYNAHFRRQKTLRRSVAELL